MDYDQSLQFSEFCIDWLIIKTYHNIDCYQQLNALESCMLPKQKAYYYVISEEYVSTKEYLDLTMKAFHIMQNSYFLNILCGVYFLCGEYSKIHQCEDKLVSYTLEEGNTFQLAEFYALNGTAYACLNQEEMMMHYYNRSLHFLQNTKWEQDMTYHIYYNIGSTYISSGKYALALSYLEKAKKEENITEFLLAHKFGEIGRAHV